MAEKDRYEPPWFPPQGQDIAVIERCVPGGDPYNIIVCWHHDDQAWWNATGVAGPMPAQPALNEFRELLVRRNDPLPWQERLSTREAIRSELIRQHIAGERNGS